MTTTESAPAYYQIEAPGVKFSLNGTINPNTHHVVTLPPALTGKSRTYPHGRYDKVPKGFYLKTSSDEVLVVGQNSGTTSTDTYLAVPVKNLYISEYVYYPFSVYSYTDSDAPFVIVGTDDETTINITTSVNCHINLNSKTGYVSLRSGVKHSYVINRLQAVYVTTTYLSDLTGSKVVANKPISVIGGHTCAFMYGSTCDHLLEQFLPTAVWGTTYYIAPISSVKLYTLKIIAANDNTNLQIFCNSSEANFQVNEGEIVEQIHNNQQYCAIHSNKKISVVQISHHESDVGDAMMSLIPAVNDYSNKILSSTNEYPPKSSTRFSVEYKHYVNIFVLSAYYQPNSMYLIVGGENQTLTSHNWVPIVVKGTTEAYATQVELNIDLDIFQIIHLNNSALMSAITYGFGFDLLTQNRNRRTGYGHPTGLNLLKHYPSKLYACSNELIVPLL